MEDRNEPQFTIADLLEALKSERIAYADASKSVISYCREITRYTNDGDMESTKNELAWLEMETRHREAIDLRIRRAEAAIRTLNRFTKPYRD